MLIGALRTIQTQSSWEWINAGRQGATIAEARPDGSIPVGTLIDGAIANNPLIKNNPERLTHIAMNWGVNDQGEGGANLTESLWISRYDAIISYLHDRFPNAVFYASYPWRVGWDTQAASMKGWIDTVISHCSNIGATCSAGVDEAIVIKANDNGYLETDISTNGSGVHYTNPLGVGLYADAMKAVLGF